MNKSVPISIAAKVYKKDPCCKDNYYKLYRKFFYILSNNKN